jgi:hypothetical protein
MRMTIIAIILGLSFTFCSKPKTPQTVDPVLKAAQDLLAVEKYDSRASERLKTLEIEIEKAKHRGTYRDLRALPLYDRAVETFQISCRKDGKESDELWAASVNQLHKAQLARRGLQNIGPVFYDPPMPRGPVFCDPPMPRPIKQKPFGHVR